MPTGLARHEFREALQANARAYVVTTDAHRSSAGVETSGLACEDHPMGFPPEEELSVRADQTQVRPSTFCMANTREPFPKVPIWPY